MIKNGIGNRISVYEFDVREAVSVSIISKVLAPVWIRLTVYFLFRFSQTIKRIVLVFLLERLSETAE